MEQIRNLNSNHPAGSHGWFAALSYGRRTSVAYKRLFFSMLVITGLAVTVTVVARVIAMANVSGFLLIKMFMVSCAAMTLSGAGLYGLLRSLNLHRPDNDF
jgi:uncharacterized membrane protein